MSETREQMRGINVARHATRMSSSVSILILTIGLPPMIAPQLALADSAEYRMEDLGSLAGGSSVGRHMNEAGLVVGSSGIPHSNHEHAFGWAKKTGMRDLGALPGGGSYSGAFAINAGGDVVGESNTAKTVHAVIWKNQGEIVDLGALPGDN